LSQHFERMILEESMFFGMLRLRCLSEQGPGVRTDALAVAVLG
jgi:hypothetical protein